MALGGAELALADSPTGRRVCVCDRAGARTDRRIQSVRAAFRVTSFHQRGIPEALKDQTFRAFLLVGVQHFAARRSGERR